MYLSWTDDDAVTPDSPARCESAAAAAAAGVEFDFAFRFVLLNDARLAIH